MKVAGIRSIICPGDRCRTGRQPKILHNGTVESAADLLIGSVEQLLSIEDNKLVRGIDGNICTGRTAPAKLLSPASLTGNTDTQAITGLNAGMLLLRKLVLRM